MKRYIAYHPYPSVEDMYMEWSIWSKCFGKIIVLNGVSSCGKTTLAAHLTKYGYNKISFDEVIEENLIDRLGCLLQSDAKEAIKLLRVEDVKRILGGAKLSANAYTPEKKIQ